MKSIKMKEVALVLWAAILFAMGSMAVCAVSCSVPNAKDGKEYVLFICDGEYNKDTFPALYGFSNLVVHFDQKTASAGKCAFDAFPDPKCDMYTIFTVEEGSEISFVGTRKGAGNEDKSELEYDADLDGEVDENDAKMIRSQYLYGGKLAVGDINDDGMIDTEDALLVLLKTRGLAGAGFQCVTGETHEADFECDVSELQEYRRRELEE